MGFRRKEGTIKIETKINKSCRTCQHCDWMYQDEDWIRFVCLKEKKEFKEKIWEEYFCKDYEMKHEYKIKMD